MLLRSLAKMSKVAVKHEEANHRFIGTIAETPDRCVLEYRYETPVVVDFYRTVSDPSLQGKGVAGAVVRAGFQWARDSRLKVKGSCSFVETFIRKNSEWSDISKL